MSLFTIFPIHGGSSYEHAMYRLKISPLARIFLAGPVGQIAFPTVLWLSESIFIIFPSTLLRYPFVFIPNYPLYIEN